MLLRMGYIYSNVLWYLEFIAFAVALIAFFWFVLYLASVNYVRYAPKFDYRKKYMADDTWSLQASGKVHGKSRVRSLAKSVVDTQPVCCDPGCIWFCGVIFSIITVGMCYYLAYTLLADTKLRFGIFMP